MISRRSSKLLGETYESAFSRRDYHKFPNHPGGYYQFVIEATQIYDFLYERDYAVWLCNRAKMLKSQERAVKDFIMKLHTGEIQYDATPGWDWEQRQQLGQEILRELASDILLTNDEPVCERIHKATGSLKASLELDGYLLSGDRLLVPESEVLDAQEKTDLLRSLYSELSLGNQATAFHHLALSEKHYIDKLWDDSISNSRKFLECTLAEGSLLSASKGGPPISRQSSERPVEVREYLERAGLLERSEKEALSKVYGLLSKTGGHPYMAQHDQARLLRHLALTLAEFVLLRLRGKIRS